MGREFFRRLRMEIALDARPLPLPVLPRGYHCRPWKFSLLDRHAEVKLASFCSEIDARLFRCLGEAEGCKRLMREIVGQQGFIPEATWLITYEPDDGLPPVDCGTIQGLAHAGAVGAIQNVGVVPAHRGLGLGRALVLQSLAGFQKVRKRRVILEVTAQNRPAVQLYRSIGFSLTRTTYKSAEVDSVAIC